MNITNSKIFLGLFSLAFMGTSYGEAVPTPELEPVKGPLKPGYNQVVEDNRMDRSDTTRNLDQINRQNPAETSEILDSKLNHNSIGSAILKGTTDSKIEGSVVFSGGEGSEYKALISFSGLKGGSIHGIHIHENGSCADQGKAAGGHFNPTNNKHGEPDSSETHFGDFGNVTADSDGKVETEIRKKIDKNVMSQLAQIEGKAVILHEKADDFSQPSGDAGDRIACGIIKKGTATAH